MERKYVWKCFNFILKCIHPENPIGSICFNWFLYLCHSATSIEFTGFISENIERLLVTLHCKCGRCLAVCIGGKCHHRESYLYLFSVHTKVLWTRWTGSVEYCSPRTRTFAQQTSDISSKIVKFTSMSNRNGHNWFLSVCNNSKWYGNSWRNGRFGGGRVGPRIKLFVKNWISHRSTRSWNNLQSE